VSKKREDLLFQVNRSLAKLFRQEKRHNAILDASFQRSVRSKLLDNLFFIQRIPEE
jgi:hypothetical protein